MNKIKSKLKLVGDLGVIEILKMSATHIAGSYIPLIGLVDDIIKASEGKAEFDEIRAELGKTREDFVKHEEQLAKHDGQLTEHGELLEKHGSDISGLNTLVDSLRSGLSEKLSAKEMSEKIEEMKSELGSYIIENQSKLPQYIHSADIKMASATVLCFEYFIDGNEKEYLDDLLSRMEFDDIDESAEEVFSDNISLTINFDKHLEKEFIESIYVNPIIEMLKVEDITRVKNVVYV
jgi:hypothetical protein